jgi:hypothetical protein
MLRTVFHISIFASNMCSAIYCGHFDTSFVKFDRYITILFKKSFLSKFDNGGHFEFQDGGRQRQNQRWVHISFQYTSHCPSRAWQIRECILVRALRTCIHTHIKERMQPLGICCMSPPNLENIHSKMSERLIPRALAHTRVYAMLEHDTYVSHVTCGHL